ncbi:MAG: SHOCT domain-containing protein [Christensenellales bacterium]
MSNDIIIKDTKQSEITQEISLETIISNAIKIPGVKVDRKKFLAEMFAKETDYLLDIIEKGPILAGIEESELKKISSRLIFDRTTKSSLASFAMGIPGGLAMFATIPADTLQFYGVTLKLAQELSYLYGSQDLWNDGIIDEEIVRNQLILYCGVMFGVSGATAGVRLLSTQVAKVALKKLPQKALTKTFWYPILKSIGKSVGLKVTKNTLAKGVSKAIPVIGGVVSGTLTFVSMKPMAEKLQKTLEKANFHYTEEEFNKDIEIVDAVDGIKDIIEEPKKKSLFEKSKEKFGSLFHKKDIKNENNLEQIKKLKELLEIGAITQEEFDQKKKQLLDL